MFRKTRREFIRLCAATTTTLACGVARSKAMKTADRRGKDMFSMGPNVVLLEQAIDAVHALRVHQVGRVPPTGAVDKEEEAIAAAGGPGESLAWQEQACAAQL